MLKQSAEVAHFVRRSGNGDARQSHLGRLGARHDWLSWCEQSDGHNPLLTLSTK